MTEITRANYQKLLPVIKEKIKNATFVSFDAEFSGLRQPNGDKPTSLFDNAEGRYQKLRTVVTHNAAPQVGICIVRRDSDGSRNLYHVDSYMAYVSEPSFAGFRSNEKALLLSYKSGKFLRQCKFDFNSLAETSVPYLNRNGVQELAEYMRNHPDFMKMKKQGRYFDPILFPDDIELYNESEIIDLVDRLRGIAEIVDPIIEYNIPVVGHNMALDLLYFLKMFCFDLPENYDAFKIMTRAVLSNVYDTKYMVNSCRRMLNHPSLRGNDDKEKLKLSSLYGAYQMTSSAVEKFIPELQLNESCVAFQKSLISGRNCDLELERDNLAHNPAFDACVTGVLFLNLTLISAKLEHSFNNRNVPPCIDEMFLNVQTWKDQVYLARASVKAMNLNGDDPRPSRPRWLVARTYREFSMEAIKKQLESFGPVDGQQINARTARYATTSFRIFKQMKIFLKQQNFYVKEQEIPNALPDSSINNDSDKFYDSRKLLG